jgi:hypothetical protein
MKDGVFGDVQVVAGLNLQLLCVFLVHLKLVFHCQNSLFGVELQVLHYKVGVQNQDDRLAIFFHQLQAVDVGALVETVHISDVLLLGVSFILWQELHRFNVGLVARSLILKKEAEVNSFMLCAVVRQKLKHG